MTQPNSSLQADLRERFAEEFALPEGAAGNAALAGIAAHRSHRKYSARAVDAQTIRLLCACALSSPTKSDLQQRDIINITDPQLRGAIADLLPDAPWVRAAPAFLVFCGNGARIGEVAAMRGKPFPNNHLDLFFNAVGDAAIALATFVNAAEALGLGCCPISEIRNHAAAVDKMLGLPPQVFPFAGLCLGWPAGAGKISHRLPLPLTLHENRYGGTGLAAAVAQYDTRRAAAQPYEKQRHLAAWGRAEDYGWSEDKARQYSVPNRADFGAYVRAKGFLLE
ncbi:MAG: nitroreductase [Betaproteobacteria bacterium]|nr:nitroreductase [Betaproteobacteria bacterium]